MIRPATLALLSITLAAVSAPADAHGFDPDRLARVVQAVERAVGAGQVAGAVVLVGRGDGIVLEKAIGRRSVVPADEPMTTDTLFDMASLTKPVATATSVMLLIERGLVRLDDPIGRHLPEMEPNGKGKITVEQLLRHRGGLIADNAIADYAEGAETAWRKLEGLGLAHPPGERFLYSDVGFQVLGRLVEKVSGQSLDAFASENVFRPLGMDDTSFLPADPARCAPTEPATAGEAPLRGVVHDPRARALGGVAGHAGLFGTARDLARYARMLLDGGRGPDGRRILAPLTVRAMTDPGDTPPRQRRGLGWDIDTGFSAPRGSLFPVGGFGHTGFTGTSIWIDPTTKTYVILLTSRLHPDGKRPSPTALRSAVATLTAAAIVEVSAPDDSGKGQGPAPSGDVLCGIDVLARDGFGRLVGKRVGLVTNHTGLTRGGTPTIDALAAAKGVTLAALFSPEHGIRGQLDRENIADGRDEKTGLPIYSLYGKTRKPTPESLKGLDLLVYDIQDIGTRFYTYISTLGLVMEAAAEAKIPLVVLDRPNPIGGLRVDGPIREAEFASFIASHDLPLIHGLTVGELARMVNAERRIGCDLAVIPCEGWRREDEYDRTGLLWVNPSPNMRSLTQAILYPGVGLLEATNLATGRGTDTPFERVGAPYIEPLAFANALNGLALPGVRFLPVRFSPTERQFTGEDCGGVIIQITDRQAIRPLDVGLGLASVLRSLHRDDWKPDGLLRFLCDRPSYRAILDAEDRPTIRALWGPGLEAFRVRREPFLLYR